MAQFVRQADVRWLSHPPGGHARISVQSRAFTALPMSLSWASEPNPREVTPGELLVAGFAAAFTTDLAELLLDAGHPASELSSNGTVTFTGGDSELSHQLASLDFRVRARVPGIDAGAFADVADDALHHFRSTKGLREDLSMSINAALVGQESS
jgi:organic hydroperoxide reductase OsmC/OhrA